MLENRLVAISSPCCGNHADGLALARMLSGYAGSLWGIPVLSELSSSSDMTTMVGQAEIRNLVEAVVHYHAKHAGLVAALQKRAHRKNAAAWLKRLVDGGHGA